MRILGVNMGFSRPKEATPSGLRHQLSDGSAALLENGKLVFAGIEERHTRRRYQGGFGSAVQAFCNSDSEHLAEPIDIIAVSSCCGPHWPAGGQTAEEIQECLPPDLWRGSDSENHALVIVDHHESHAALGFALSGASKALVAVLDGFGNLIDLADWDSDQWWRGRFQRHSYYVASKADGGFNLQCVAREADRKDEVGLGEAYRAITHFCGWRSYQQAGSAMALAAYGDGRLLDGVSFVGYDENRIRCMLRNDHPNPAGAIEALLRKGGAHVDALFNRTATPRDRGHCSAVRAMQDQLTDAICGRVLALAEKHQADTVIVAGGVAMNCLAMGELQRRFPGNVFVPPAPSDTGQGLGNAIWAHACTASPLFRKHQPEFVFSEAPFWGVPSNNISKAIRHAQSWSGVRVVEKVSLPDQFAEAAQLLANGKLVAVCMGRSEYGPRALGRRSVLFDPRRPDAPSIVNRFKQREPYRPFAPALLHENVRDFLSWPVQSPFMSFAVEVQHSARQRIPGVLHADGTARVQTIGPQSGSPLRPILESFLRITGIPVLLNTSFNRKGEPMIETPWEAVDAFVRSSLDVLLLDGVTLHKVPSYA